MISYVGEGVHIDGWWLIGAYIYIALLLAFIIGCAYMVYFTFKNK